VGEGGIESGNTEMSAAGLAQGQNYATRTRVISAHADYRRSDFMFSRTQSHTMRDTPWDTRIKPMRPWSEIYGLAAAVCLCTVLVSAFI
jgi:hypothetical protein